MIAVFMFSLTGIPPLAGFWGKLQIFGSALNVDAVSDGAEFADVVCGSGDYRRAERGNFGGLLLADCGRNVFSSHLQLCQRLKADWEL